jgi:hypothetical protein
MEDSDPRHVKLAGNRALALTLGKSCANDRTKLGTQFVVFFDDLRM